MTMNSLTEGFLVCREASVRFTAVDWDYSQQYPNTGGENRAEAGIETKKAASPPTFRTEGTDDTGNPREPVFYYDVAASGYLEASMYVHTLPEMCLFGQTVTN